MFVCFFQEMAEPSADVQVRPQDVQALIREATLILKEPLEVMAGPLRTYRKRIQVGLMNEQSISNYALSCLISHGQYQCVSFTMKQ